MTYIVRPTKYTLYRKGDNPIFGVTVTELSLDDDAGGIFLTILQHDTEHGPGGTLRLDFDEIPQLIRAIQALHEQAIAIEKEDPKETPNGYTV